MLEEPDDDIHIGRGSIGHAPELPTQVDLADDGLIGREVAGEVEREVVVGGVVVPMEGITIGQPKIDEGTMLSAEEVVVIGKVA